MQIKATKPQADFMQMAAKYKGFFGGYGTGKSETLANCAIIDAMHSPGALIGIYEPTYDLVRLIIAPRILGKLDEYGIRYKYNKQENIIYTSGGGIGDFILRTLDNPERIVGFQVFRSHIDELDTLPMAKASDAWNKVIARNRQSVLDVETGEPYQNQVSTYSTPEGYKFCYNRWVRDGGVDYDYIQAATTSNPFLPPDYVQSLRDTYPAELISAYLEGHFVNMASGSVYNHFSRTANHASIELDGNEEILIGQDFNIGGCVSIIGFEQGDDLFICDEMVSKDTFEVGEQISAKYPNATLYPDSSGKNRSSNSSKSDVDILREYGLYCAVRGANPRVRDRILATNNGFYQKQIWIDTDKCPKLTEALERQAYQPNGEPEKFPGAATVDDFNDALGYLCYAVKPVIKPKFTQFKN